VLLIYLSIVLISRLIKQSFSLGNAFYPISAFVKKFFLMTRQLEEQEIMFVSHKLEVLFEVCDCLTVIRADKRIDKQKAGDLDRERVIEMIIRRRCSEVYIRNLYTGSHKAVSEAVDITKAGETEHFFFL